MMSKRFLPNLGSTAERRWANWLAFAPLEITRKRLVFRMISGESVARICLWSDGDLATNVLMNKNATANKRSDE